MTQYSFTFQNSLFCLLSFAVYVTVCCHTSLFISLTLEEYDEALRAREADFNSQLHAAHKKRKKRHSQPEGDAAAANMSTPSNKKVRTNEAAAEAEESKNVEVGGVFD